MNMPQNIGDTDRNLRFLAGAAIILLGLYLQSWLGLIGIVLLGTAYVRSCPAYTALGVDTSKK